MSDRRSSVATESPESTTTDYLWLIGLAVVALAAGFHAVRALTGGWIASGDDAFWSIMARSVFSRHPPMLGSSSSGGLDSGTGFHHLGPIGFYLLAPFVKALGGVGLAVGTALINGLATVMAAIAVRSGVGHRAGWLVLAAGALIQFSMGSEVLVDPWNPHFATLPFWFALCCTWAVVAGDTRWAPPGVFAASFALQTHLSFAPFAGLIGLVLLGSTWVTCARMGSESEHETSAVEPPSTNLMSRLSLTGGSRWNPLWWSVVVGLGANAIPLIQQFFGPGPGNLTNALAGSSSETTPTIGLRTGTRVMSYLISPQRWLPGQWNKPIIWFFELPSFVPVFIVVMALSGLLAASLYYRRPRDAAMMILSLIVCVGSVLLASRTTTILQGGQAPMARMSLFRWAWPTMVFLYLVASQVALSLWQSRSASTQEPVTDDGTPTSRWTAISLFVVVVALVLGNVPVRDEGSGVVAIQRSEIRELLNVAGPVVIENGKPFIQIGLEPSPVAKNALMEWLDERGHSFGITDPTVIRQAGERFRANGTETSTVAIPTGLAVLVGPEPGFRRVFETLPVSERDILWFRATSEEVSYAIIDYLDAKNLDNPVPNPPVVDGIPLGWTKFLCGRFQLLPDNAETRRTVISRRDRKRMCRIHEDMENKALALDLGPAPTPSG